MTEKAKKETPVHKVKIKPNPIWIRTSYVGKYNGIRFRFEYKEYNNEDAEDVIKVFKFVWPTGKIPDDKEYAEKGIMALFNKRLEDESIEFRVIKDEESVLVAEAGDKLIDDPSLSDEYIEEIIKEIDDKQDIVPKGQ